LTRRSSPVFNFPLSLVGAEKYIRRAEDLVGGVLHCFPLNSAYLRLTVAPKLSPLSRARCVRRLGDQRVTIIISHCCMAQGTAASSMQCTRVGWLAVLFYAYGALTSNPATPPPGLCSSVSETERAKIIYAMLKFDEISPLLALMLSWD
jgi:hypothetical protein